MRDETLVDSAFWVAFIQGLEKTSFTFILLSAFVLSGLVFTYRVYIYPLFLSPLRHAPGPPFGHWLWGQIPQILKAEAGILQREWLKSYGDRRGIIRAIGPLGLERIMFLSPEAQKKVLVNDWLEYPRPDFMKNILGLVAGFGLLTVTGDQHRQMRKFMNPAFSITSLTAQTGVYYTPIYTLIGILSRRISKGQHPEVGSDLEMYPFMSKVTLDIICLAAFGYEANSLENPDNELASAYEKLIDLQNGKNLSLFILVCAIPGVTTILQSEWMWKHRDWLRRSKTFAPLATLADAMRRIKVVSSAILEEKLAETSGVLASDTTSKKDIMSLLVRARTNEERGRLGVQEALTTTPITVYRMSDQEMMDQVLTFLGAGHETTASGLSWTLWLLAKHPAAQRRLHSEVAALLENNPTPSYRELKESTWLDCVVMESLRLMPPVPMTVRKAAKGDWIDGIYVPKGTLFYIPIRVTNQWQEVWGDDAEEFRPERWLNLGPKYHSTFSFQTFISGPHACIGRTMAIMEMKAVLATFLTYFSIEPVHKDQVAKPTAAVTMKPADNLPLRVRPIVPFKDPLIRVSES